MCRIEKGRAIINPFAVFLMFIFDFVDLYLFGCLVSICFGVLKCWLTGWIVLSGLIGAWFLYVIRWFNFPLGSPLGTHFWEL